MGSYKEHKSEFERDGAVFQSIGRRESPLFDQTDNCSEESGAEKQMAKQG